MQKFFSLFAALTIALSSFAATFNIYIDNQTGWEETALYAWADGRNDILGGWPGITPSSSIEKDGATYLVFTVDETAVPANFIFNNNGNDKQLADYPIETAADIYLVATTVLAEVGAPAPVYANYIYVDDQTGWDNIAMYAYDGNGRNTILGGWPGKQADDQITKDGVTYKAFGIPADFAPANIILNNNGGGTQLADFVIEEQKDYYLIASAEGVREAGTDAPTVNTFHLYVSNQTGWTEFDLYAWGTPNEAFGGWPGITEPAKATIDGIEYNDYPFNVVEGGAVELHLIFHNNVGEGVEGDMRQLFDVTEARDYFLVVSADSVVENKATGVEIVPAENGLTSKILRNGQLIILRNGETYDVTGRRLNIK